MNAHAATGNDIPKEEFLHKNEVRILQSQYSDTELLDYELGEVELIVHMYANPATRNGGQNDRAATVG